MMLNHNCVDKINIDIIINMTIDKRDTDEGSNIDLSQQNEKAMSETERLLIKMIGSLGCFESQEIIFRTLEYTAKLGIGDTLPKNPSISLAALAQNGYLYIDKNIKHPWKSNFAAYDLTGKGKEAYKTLFHEEPVRSEKNELISRYENIERGLGYKCLLQILNESCAYNGTSLETYDGNVIAIAAARHGGGFSYFQYENGASSQEEINSRLDKIVRSTDVLNIIVPNRNIARSVKGQVKIWKSLRGCSKDRSALKVNITTLKRLQNEHGVINVKNRLHTV